MTSASLPKRKPTAWRIRLNQVPLVFAAIGLFTGGVFLLHRSEAQARDTIRKHHLQDIENALYFAYSLHGTYPPYNEPTWCGRLNETSSRGSARQEIEANLRQQNEKYANPAKPFPTDPLQENRSPRVAPPWAGHSRDGRAPDYFYWKRSPTVFELYSILETDLNHTRSSRGCPKTPLEFFDYGLNSLLRGNGRTS